MRDYIWRYPRGSYIQERWFDLGNPGLDFDFADLHLREHHKNVEPAIEEMGLYNFLNQSQGGNYIFQRWQR